MYLVSGATSAQRVFRIKMNFPTSVLCNEAGQGVLKQKVRNAVNSLNRDWNFCSYSYEGNTQFTNGLFIIARLLPPFNY